MTCAHGGLAGAPLGDDMIMDSFRSQTNKLNLRAGLVGVKTSVSIR
jgi:hypothetical protein